MNNQTKTCSKCKGQKQLADFSKDSAKVDGLRCYCRACATVQNKAHYDGNSGAMRARAVAYRAANPEIIAKKNAEYRTAAHGKAQAATKRWLTNNPGAKPEHDRTYRAKHASSLSKSKKAYEKANPEKRAVHAKKYRSNHAAEILVNTRARQARKLRAVPGWANTTRILEVYKEAKALSEMLDIKFHVDHIVPLKSELVSGLHCEANLQILEASRNISKGNRTWPDMP